MSIQARMSHHRGVRFSWSLTGDDPYRVWRSIEPYLARGFRVDWKFLP